MSDIEHVPAEDVEVVSDSATLFDEYNLRLVDLGAGPVLLTPEGQGIFGAHMRMNEAQRLASIFGYLIERRLREPLDEAVTVVDIDPASLEDNDQHWIASQAIWRTPNFLGIEDLWMVDLEKHEMVDEQGNEVTINEVELPDGAFVSTHLGRNTYKVILTPTSVLQPA